jgi:hypothetical protein
MAGRVARQKQLFLKDAERARQRMLEAKHARENAQTLGDKFLSPVLGAGVGFLAGGPAGAVAGGLKGLTTKSKGLEHLVQTGTAGFTGGQVAPAGGLEALADPKNLSQSLEVVKAGIGNPLEVLGSKAKRQQEEKKSKAKTKAEQAKFEREQGGKIEIEKIKQQGDIALEKLKQKGKDKPESTAYLSGIQGIRKYANEANKIIKPYLESGETDNLKKYADAFYNRMNAAKDGVYAAEKDRKISSAQRKEVIKVIEKEIKNFMDKIEAGGL